MGIVLDVDANDWEREVLQSDLLTVVDFWHDRCPWCVMLDPVFSEVAEEYKERIRFAKLSVLASPDNREIAISYGVMGTPTLLFFCAGRPGGALGVSLMNALIVSGIPAKNGRLNDSEAGPS